ncbi:MAG: hypothetical protein AB9836_12525 [Aminipila sp.]
MSNGNSSKSQIFLMEFICVVMFFALCAALCINAFVKADGMSKEGRELNEALLLAQSLAETIKSMDSPSNEDISTIVDKMNRECRNKYMVKVKDKVQADMYQADIYVYDTKSSKNEICTLSIKKYLPGEV